MHLPLILVIWPYGFRSFDWERLELDYLMSHADVEVHELINALTPHFIKAYANRLETEKVKQFSTIGEWRNRLSTLQKDKSRRIFILNFTRVDCLRSLWINFYLLRSDCTIVDYYQPGVPDISSLPSRMGLTKIYKKIITGVLQKNIGQTLLRKISKILGNTLNLNPNYRIVGGEVDISKWKKFCADRDIKLINGHSWDYSKTLRSKSPLDAARPYKYAVHLDGSGPMFASDSLLYNTPVSMTTESWYPSLVRFFDKLELSCHLRFVIAPHPKTKHDRFPAYFGEREVVSDKTIDLVRDCEFVVTRMSTAISYAITYNKPVIFIYSNQLKKDSQSMNQIEFMASECGTMAVNIDDTFDNKDLLSLVCINQKCRGEYIKKYLTTRNDSKPNYQILLDEIISRPE
jgi:hypothetical protein